MAWLLRDKLALGLIIMIIALLAVAYLGFTADRAKMVADGCVRTAIERTSTGWTYVNKVGNIPYTYTENLYMCKRDGDRWR